MLIHTAVKGQARGEVSQGMRDFKVKAYRGCKKKLNYLGKGPEFTSRTVGQRIGPQVCDSREGSNHSYDDIS